MSDNLKETRSGRQYVKALVVRFSGADVGADYAASAALGMTIDLPPGATILRGQIETLVVDSGAVATFNVGTSAAESLYGANIAVAALGDVALAGTGIGRKVVEASTIAVTEGTGTINNDGDHVLTVEYVVEGAANEVYG